MNLYTIGFVAIVVLAAVNVLLRLTVFRRPDVVAARTRERRWGLLVTVAGVVLLIVLVAIEVRSGT